MTDTPTEITVHRQLILDERLPNDGSYPLAAEYTITREEAITFVREALRLHSTAPAGPVAVMFDCVQPVTWRGDFEEMDAGDVEDVAALPEYDGISLWDGTLSVDRHGVFLKATDHGREVAHVGLTSIEDLIQSFGIQYNEVAPVAYKVHAQQFDSDHFQEQLCADAGAAKDWALFAANGLCMSVGLPPDEDPERYEETVARARTMYSETRGTPTKGGVRIDTVRLAADPGPLSRAFDAVADADKARRPKPR